MNLSTAVIRGVAKQLDDNEREMLRMLLDGDQTAKKLATNTNTNAHLTARKVATKLRSLARRTLVVHVLSPASAYWCLTDEGKQVASVLTKSCLWKMTPPDRSIDQ